MRKLTMMALSAVVLGLAGAAATPASAAPIGNVAALPDRTVTGANPLLEPVHWRRWRHCHWRHGWRRCHGGYRRHYRHYYYGGYPYYYGGPSIYLRFGGHRHRHFRHHRFGGHRFSGHRFGGHRFGGHRFGGHRGFRGFGHGGRGGRWH